MSHNSQKIRVLVDLDGVIRDFIGGLTRIYRREFPDHVIKTVRSRRLEAFFPIGERIYDFIDRQFLEEILTGAPPYPGAIEAMRRWEHRFENVIVTAQPRRWRYPTFIWLGKFKVPTNEIHICYHKEAVEGLALLDDFVDNLEAFRATGRLAVCMDQPWNQDWTGPRVTSLNEFYQFVLEAVNSRNPEG